MAIVQVSQITNRLGLETNLPQLAGAELGWAVDSRRLWIGNGTLQEGAPVIGNTEILTEFSDILAIEGSYTYQGAAAGYSVQTGPTSGTPVAQSLQSWLDQYASVTDFGAVGDGVTDDTEAINRALYQLYCRQSNPQIRRSLFFPAGRYLITETIIIPPYARLIGEGANSSVVVLDTSSDLSSLSAYCARFGDSLQQTGVNIGNNGATPPTNIEIASMGFECAEVTDIFLIEDAAFCTFTDVSFVGPLQQIDLTTFVDDIAAIRFASSLSLVCNNITFRRCEFTGTNWAINTAQQLKGVSVDQCKFDTLYQGILLGEPAPVNGGPSGFRVTNSTFDNIYAEGIKIASNTYLNASGYNMFFDVGNHFNGTTSPATPVINFESSNNVSIGDLFQRTTAYSGTYPRISINDTLSIGIDSSSQMQMGTYVRETGTTQTINNNAGSTTILTFDATVIRAVRIDYTIVRDVNTRTGSFTIVASTDGTGGSLAQNDTGYQNASTGVALTATETGSTVTWQYTSTNTGISGYIHYSVTRLA